MNLFDKLRRGRRGRRGRFGRRDGTEAVAALVRAWAPEGCTTERAYETSLYHYLHDKLADLQVTRQYARDRSAARDRFMDSKADCAAENSHPGIKFGSERPGTFLKDAL